MECGHCRKGSCKKSGKQGNGTQKYRCKACGKYQQAKYLYNACCPGTDARVIAHVKEGCGIWNTARLMKISKTTVLARIKSIGARLRPPKAEAEGLDYEMDELHTFVGSKRADRYVCYAICRATRRVVDFVTGARTKETLGKVTARLLETAPRRVHTDGLNIYPTLIPKAVHKPGKFGTLRIERKNLTLRMNLKRLGRRTICFSRSVAVLEASLRIWFWG